MSLSKPDSLLPHILFLATTLGGVAGCGGGSGGGIHTPVEGSVTLDNAAASRFGLEAGKVYEVAVFQAERQTNSSTFKITLGGFNTTPSECHPN